MNARELAVTHHGKTPIKPITPALIQSARMSALAQGRRHLMVLEEESGLSPEEFTQQLSDLFAVFFSHGENRIVVRAGLRRN